LARASAQAWARKYFDVQGTAQFMGEESACGTVDEHFGGGQQRVETREPGVCLGPQALVHGLIGPSVLALQRPIGVRRPAGASGAVDLSQTHWARASWYGRERMLDYRSARRPPLGFQ
jgi:hypothetical protein